MPRVSLQQLAERCIVRVPDYRTLAHTIAVLLGVFASNYPDKDLGHVIAVELGYGHKSPLPPVAKDPRSA